MQGHVPNVWDLKERNWLQAEEEPGRSSNWDAKVSEVKPPLNQTLCILVKFARDLRPHFQSVFFFFLRCTFFDNCSPYGIYGPNSLWQLGIAFFFSAGHKHITQTLLNSTSHRWNSGKNHFSLSQQHDMKYISPGLHLHRPYLQLNFCYSPYGAWFGVSSAERQALLCWAQSEKFHNPRSQFMQPLCGKIQNSTKRQLREKQCTREGRSAPRQGKENTE